MAYDGTLLFGTGVDITGFTSGVATMTTAAAAAATTITAGLSAAAIKVGSEFEAAMSQVGATMGITSASKDFEILSAAAKEMGESTKYSAAQASSALNYLALAGYDAEKSIAALPTVLNVAAAGGMELASASDMITDAMSALGLETAQMSTFADQLAVTSQKSNTSVAQLGEATMPIILDNPYTLYAIFKQNINNSAWSGILTNQTNSFGIFVNQNKIAVYDPSTREGYTTDVSALNYHICAITFYNGLGSLYVDGVLKFTRANINLTNYSYYITYVSNFKMIAVCNNVAHGSADILANTKYLAEKYGIEI